MIKEELMIRALVASIFAEKIDIPPIVLHNFLAKVKRTRNDFLRSTLSVIFLLDLGVGRDFIGSGQR